MALNPWISVTSGRKKENMMQTLQKTRVLPWMTRNQARRRLVVWYIYKDIGHIILQICFYSSWECEVLLFNILLLFNLWGCEMHALPAGLDFCIYLVSMMWKRRAANDSSQDQGISLFLLVMWSCVLAQITHFTSETNRKEQQWTVLGSCISSSQLSARVAPFRRSEEVTRCSHLYSFHSWH